MVNPTPSRVPAPPDTTLANVTTLLRILLPLILPIAVTAGWIQQGDVVTITEVVITIVSLGSGIYKNHRAADHINQAAIMPTNAPRPRVPL